MLGAIADFTRRIFSDFRQQPSASFSSLRAAVAELLKESLVRGVPGKRVIQLASIPPGTGSVFAPRHPLAPKCG